MERVHVYLDAIEEIDRIERCLAQFRDAKGLTRLQCALDAAQAAWLSIPAASRAKLEPPPTLEG